VRFRAAYVLGKVGPAAACAEPALREALKDEELTVRMAAEEALRSISGK